MAVSHAGARSRGRGGGLFAAKRSLARAIVGAAACALAVLAAALTAATWVAPSPGGHATAGAAGRRHLVLSGGLLGGLAGGAAALAAAPPPPGGWQKIDAAEMSRAGGPSGIPADAVVEQAQFFEAAGRLRAAAAAVRDEDFATLNTAMAQTLPVLRVVMPQLSQDYNVAEADLIMRSFYDNLDDFATRMYRRSWERAARSYGKMIACLDHYEFNLRKAV